MSMAYVAIGTAVLGAATSAYGANKQAKATQSAANQNATLQGDQNQQAWANYLMTRGLSPNGAPTGTIPTNAPAINTKLPLWANANFATGPSGWRKKGSMPAAGTLSRAPMNYGGAQNTQLDDLTAQLAAAQANQKVSTGQKVKNFLDPVGLTIGKDTKFWDPLGFF